MAPGRYEQWKNACKEPDEPGNILYFSTMLRPFLTILAQQARDRVPVPGAFPHPLYGSATMPTKSHPTIASFVASYHKPAFPQP